MTGLAALWFGAGCGAERLDSPPPAAAASPPVAATSGGSSGSIFRPLGDGRGAVANACTRTASYWQQHPTAWWHRELQMGQTTYSKEEQLGILERGDEDNGLVTLGQQLIAARLNIDAGVSPEGLEETLARADQLIGVRVIPPRGEDWLDRADADTAAAVLGAFNAGQVGPGACP
jgi:hypothetical protein